MTEESRKILCQNQRQNRPKIEDVIPDYMDGDMKQTALDFAAYMRANKMSLGWSDVNVWKAVNKGNKLCEIRLNGRFWGEDKKWVVVLNLPHMDEYAELIVDAGMQEMIWENVFYCKCYPSPGCGGRGKYTILGREIEGIGGCNRWSSVFRDPGKAAVECIKKLLDWERKARNSVATPADEWQNL